MNFFQMLGAFCIYRILLSEHIYLLNLLSIVGAHRVSQCSNVSSKIQSDFLMVMQVLQQCT